jgi:hypothetical protein
MCTFQQNAKEYTPIIALPDSLVPGFLSSIYFFTAINDK